MSGPNGPNGPAAASTGNRQRSRPIVPPSTVGMLGGGQLGRYAVWAARRMGYRTIVLDPDPSAPAGRIADEHIVAAFDDRDAVQRLGSDCAVVTAEFENPPYATLEHLDSITTVAPPPSAIAVAQDRIAEKRFLVDAGIPVAPFVVVDPTDEPDPHDLDWEGDRPGGFPAVLKTARLGYDGKGQSDVGSPDELPAAWRHAGRVACVLERRLELDVEVSVVVARSRAAEIVTYQCTENRHSGGILDVSIAPARVDDELAERATVLGSRIAAALDYTGVLAVEMFVIDGELLVNEMAPRPHNSGHWTLDGAETDQFAQQIRTVGGHRPGPVDMTAPAVAMANLLGDAWTSGEPDWALALADPSVRLHLYGKDEPLPGRKMGHLTATAVSADEALARVTAARSSLG